MLNDPKLGSSFKSTTLGGSMWWRAEIEEAMLDQQLAHGLCCFYFWEEVQDPERLWMIRLFLHHCNAPAPQWGPPPEPLFCEKHRGSYRGDGKLGRIWHAPLPSDSWKAAG